MTAQPVAATDNAQLFAVYDNGTQEIGRVYQTQRDAQTCCDERNSWLGTDRYVVEPVPADEWDDGQVVWSQ